MKKELEEYWNNPGIKTLENNLSPEPGDKIFNPTTTISIKDLVKRGKIKLSKEITDNGTNI